MSEFQLREVFNQTTVTYIASQIKQVHPEFNQQDFEHSVLAELDQLSFGDRSTLIRDQLSNYLPQNFIKACNILIDALGPKLTEPELKGYDGFYVMPMSMYVSKYGLDYPDLSLHALLEMTMRFSSEGPIRAFIRKYPGMVFEQMQHWLKDPNPHVRRLVSEGTRPRLPLSSPLHEYVKDPQPILNLLDDMKDEPTRLVQRSIANNLNDISKDNPDQVIALCKSWKQAPSVGKDWMIRHGLRTLLKQGNLDALAILGFPSDIELSIENFTLQSDKVKIGETLEFEVLISSPHDVELMIDYIIHYVKKNGKTSPKTFKWGIKSLQKGATIKMVGKQSFRQMSTRTHYAGRHKIELMINGKIWESIEFNVT